MKATEATKQLISCQQLFSLWSTEPELIQIIDLRSPRDFEEAHIPGAIWGSLNSLPDLTADLKGKLAILIPAEDQQNFDALAIKGVDYMVLGDCKAWIRDNHPLAGQAIFQIQANRKSREASMAKESIIFQQLFEPTTSTYTYLIADPATKEAALIDPVLETVDRDLKLVEELGLRLMYVLDTHIHADHITGAGEIRKQTQAKTAVSVDARVNCVDIPLEDGQELLLGNKPIRVISTPGHTDTCLSFYFEGRIFTGDALLIRGTGRTDFQAGNSETLYDSVHQKLFKLPEDTLVYPGHDYRGMTSSTIGLEKKFNPRLGMNRTKAEFVQTMAELKLANPKRIHEAVPANMACGKPKEARVLHPQVVDGIPEVTPQDVFRNRKDLILIDVRRPEEFNNELAHVEGARLITLGPDLTQFLEGGDRASEIVFICRSGARSGHATAESQKLGYKFTANMLGGMIRWNDEKLPTERTK